MSPSEHIKELKVDSTLWADPKRIVNLLDFAPKKLGIYTELNSILVIYQTQALKIL